MSDQQQVFWHILMVDDDQDDYRITGNMLNKLAGVKVQLDWASTYEEGQKLLHAEHYDAVLVDYMLGPCNGLDLIRQAIDLGYSAPLILYTDCLDENLAVEAAQAGAIMVISKLEASPPLMERLISPAIARKRNPLSPKPSLSPLHTRLLGSTSLS